MERRDFLKGAAAAAAVAAMGPVLKGCRRNDGPRDDIYGPAGAARDFRFGPDGSFKVLQITDTHYIAGDPRSERALRCVEALLDQERPDLVIHTGDILFGAPDVESALEALAPIAERGIPFAVALGNHDAQFGHSREEIYAVIRSVPGCVNLPPHKGVSGVSNDVLTLSSARGVERVFFLMDSGDAVVLKGEEDLHCYDYFRLDQLLWYRRHSEAFTAAAGGTPVPSLAFFHIPLREYPEGLAALSDGSGMAELVGNNGEPPCPSRLNSGFAAQVRELGDVEAVVAGHEHDCDYVLRYGPLFYIYGRYSGCDTVYNHLGHNGIGPDKISGGRVFSFRAGAPGFDTWVRLVDGARQFPLHLESGTLRPL